MERIETEINKEYSTTSNDLLKRLTTKQIDITEFLMECAYWYMTDTFDSISFKPNPTKPAEVREYERLNYKQKERLSDEYFEEKWQIDKYYESVYKMLWINVGNFKMMEHIYNNIPEGDMVNRGKLKRKIENFNKRIEWWKDNKWARRSTVCTI